MISQQTGILGAGPANPLTPSATLIGMGWIDGGDWWLPNERLKSLLYVPVPKPYNQRHARRYGDLRTDCVGGPIATLGCAR